MEIFTFVKRYAIELTMIAINCILAIGGAFVLYMTIHIRHAGWEDVIHDYWSNINDAVTALIVIGSVIIGLAIFGSIAALYRWRFIICTYGIGMVLLLIFFVVVAIAAFILLDKANDWSDTIYPAKRMEETVKTNFNTIYCYAQGEYVCDKASVTEALAMFAPKVNTSVVSLLQNIPDDVTTLCDNNLDGYSQLESLCIACDTVSKLKNYSTVLVWANEKCPRTTETMIYCSQLLAGISTANITIGTAPYLQCRTKFLDLVEDYSLYLGIASVVICFGALILIICICYLNKRKEQNDHNHTDLNEYPLTPSTEQFSCDQYFKA